MAILLRFFRFIYLSIFLSIMIRIHIPLCKKKEKDLRKYRNDQGKTIKVCRACTVYAERRAYRKIS